MCNRLERTFHQAIRFTADASHELKTPLTVLQAQVEQAVHECETGSEEQQRYVAFGKELQRLKSITQKLLLLSRIDAGELKLNLRPLDLSRFNVKNKVARAREVERMGADYLCVHVGVDEQMVGGTPLSELKGLSDAVKIPIAAAGGINSETAPSVVKAGVAIVIVGGAIIKAKDVTAAARLVKNAITSGKGIKSTLSKKYGEKELYEAFTNVSSPNVAEAQHKKGAMKGIHPRIKHNLKMVGRALTVHTVNGDWAKPVEAIDRAKPGDVIVIDACSGEIAVWGELASWSCKTKGVAGVVIDGAARDIDSIIDLEFPCFSRYV